jgi:hypothetical protein
MRPERSEDYAKDGPGHSDSCGFGVRGSRPTASRLARGCSELEPALRADRLSWNREDIMVNRNHRIVQDERGQDQPVSKIAAHRTETTMPKDARKLNPRDICDNLCEPVNDHEGKPRADRIPLKTTCQETAQPSADVQPEPDLSHPEHDLPEGLRRPRTGPYGPTKGRA